MFVVSTRLRNMLIIWGYYSGHFYTIFQLFQSNQLYLVAFYSSRACILLLLSLPGASNTPKIVGPVKNKNREKPGFCKEPIIWFLLDLHKCVQIGWTCINCLLIACSNFILTTYEFCRTERAVETEASATRHDARILHRLQLPPMLRTFPSAGLEVVKKSLWICMAFQMSAFQIRTQ